jgi:hypothetical protein
MTADSDCRFCADWGTALSLAPNLNELRMKYGVIWGWARLSDLETERQSRSALPLCYHFLLFALEPNIGTQLPEATPLPKVRFSDLLDLFIFFINNLSFLLVILLLFSKY